MSFLHELEITSDEKKILDKYSFVIRRHKVENRSIDFHWHDYFELEIVTSGTGLHLIGGKSFAVSAGDAFLLSPAGMHAMTGYDGFQVLNICFLNSLLPNRVTDFILAGVSRQCRFSENELLHILLQAKKISLIGSSFIFEKKLITNIILEIILLILEKAATENSGGHSSLTQKAISIMVRDFKSDITLKRVSEKLSVTPKHLGAVFKQNTGSSFHEYLNNLHLKFACTLLLSSSLSVKEMYLPRAITLWSIFCTFSRADSNTHRQHSGTVKKNTDVKIKKPCGKAAELIGDVFYTWVKIKG